MCKPTGLTYIKNFIDTDFENYLLKNIKEQTWDKSIKRPVQQYGYKYVYGKRKTDIPLEKANDFPEWLTVLKDEIYPEANQCIINYYNSNEGIQPHIDNLIFANKVVSISLGAGTVMNFIHHDITKNYDIYLEPRSCVILENESRYEYKHGIKGKNIIQERISITFRVYK